MPNTAKRSATAAKSAPAAKKAPAGSKQTKNAKRENEPKLEEFFHDEIKDIYWAEKKLVKTLPKMQKAATSEELAAAIANQNNPLTSRVIVNRLWGWFFGQPIVPTPSNFGHSGQPPTYPELLDDLAVRFVQNGWSIKSMAREIMLSSAYRQSSHGNEMIGRDPGNELLSRMNRRRLAVEQWRDAVLFVAGELQPIGGKSLELDDPKNFHRTVYSRVSRLKLNDVLMQFDYPDANVHAEKRAVTTTPMQKLFLLNSPFMLDRAKALSQRLTANRVSERKRVQQAYQLLFNREPDREEMQIALQFLQKRPANVPPSPGSEGGRNPLKSAKHRLRTGS